ncbi:MAG: AraC-like DNA-binding protein [Polaribacter sp.]|jgi:AraC-like DNA-binding protein
MRTIDETLPRGQAEYVIRAEGFNAIDTLLAELGVVASTVFSEVGLDIDILQPHNSDLEIDYQTFLKLLNHCADISGRQDFGALLSRYQDMSVIGVTGQTMLEAPTFRAALENLVDFFHLHMNGLKVGFHEYQNHSLVTLEMIMPFAPAYRQQVELSMGIGIRFLRRLLGQSWVPINAYFEHSEDSGSGTTSRLLSCPISYESEFNGYTIHNHELDIRRENFNSQLHQILHDYLSLQTSGIQNNFVVTVREKIIQAIRLNECSVDNVAEKMGLQRRTLQRRLACSGYDFKSIRQETRMDLAQRYLRISGISIIQISNVLCYADPTSFSRSFKRFFGVSPRAWRINLSQAGG